MGGAPKCGGLGNLFKCTVYRERFAFMMLADQAAER